VGTGFFALLPPDIREGLISIFGPYDVTSEYDSGDKSHGPFTLGDTITSLSAVQDPFGFMGPDPFVAVYGEFNEADGSFITEGIGTVAGFPNITVTFEGTLTQAGLSGLYSMGTEGGLPGGQSINYLIEGQLGQVGGNIPDLVITPEPDFYPASPAVMEDMEAFANIFNQAFVDVDYTNLYRLLDTNVLNIYGEEQCQTYLQSVIETPTSIEIIDAVQVGPWTFERDGISTPVTDVYSVNVNFIVRGQTSRQELHLVIPGDDSVRWFTDCGEPIP
jgi:hypothetical protein